MLLLVVCHYTGQIFLQNITKLSRTTMTNFSRVRDEWKQAAVACNTQDQHWETTLSEPYKYILEIVFRLENHRFADTCFEFLWWTGCKTSSYFLIWQNGMFICVVCMHRRMNGYWHLLLSCRDFGYVIRSYCMKQHDKCDQAGLLGLRWTLYRRWTIVYSKLI